MSDTELYQELLNIGSNIMKAKRGEIQVNYAQIIQLSDWKDTVMWEMYQRGMINWQDLPPSIKN